MRGQQNLKMENFAELLWKFADTWSQLFADMLTSSANRTISTLIKLWPWELFIKFLEGLHAQ